jgi:hypothetical protein
LGEERLDFFGIVELERTEDQASGFEGRSHEDD